MNLNAPRLWIVNWRARFDPLAWLYRFGFGLTVLFLVLLFNAYRADVATFDARERHTAARSLENAETIGRLRERVLQLEACIRDPRCVEVPATPTTTTTIVPPRPGTSTTPRPGTSTSGPTRPPSGTTTTTVGCPAPTIPLNGACVMPPPVAAP